MARATNPYIAGSAIRNQGDFFGRQDILDRVEQELRNPGTNALVLFGQRRIGKTSLLLQIQRILPESDFIVTYFDLQDQAMRSLGKVLADLSDAMLNRMNLIIKPVDNIADDETGRLFRTNFLPTIYEKIPEPKRFVVLLDEFDVLDIAAEERLTENAAAKSLLPFLRRLIADETRLVFIFVAGRRPQDLSIDFNQTFKTGLSQEVWVLDKESAVTLIKRAENNKSLNFTNQGIEKILTLTSGHPYLIQLVCQRIWERAYRSKPKTTPIIDVGEVDASLPEALQAGGQALLWLWEGLNPAERIYTAALAEISSVGKPITEDEVIQILFEHASRLRTREVELAPRELIKRRILEEVNGGYQFAIELFRLWVKQSRNLEEVKDELDRTDIPALQMFKLGVSLYEEKDWEGAIRSLKDALKRNPRLFQAQLVLGETFFEMAKYDDAVQELEKAYELDKDDSYLSLARALVAQARENEKNGNIDVAVSASQRAIQVSPNDKEAKLLNNSIQINIKEREAIGLLEKNQWMEAAKIFNELLKQSSIKNPIQEQEWKNHLHQAYFSAFTDLEVNGHAFMDAENWADAENIFKQLSSQKFIDDPDKKREWDKCLLICKLNLENTSLYEKGKLAMSQEQWDEAIKYFASILTKDQNYKDAAYLLNVAYSNKPKPEQTKTNFKNRNRALEDTKEATKESNSEESLKSISESLSATKSNSESSNPFQKGPVDLKDKFLRIIPNDLIINNFDKMRRIIVWPADLAYIIVVFYLARAVSITLLDIAQWWAYIILVIWVLASALLGISFLFGFHSLIGGAFNSFGVKYNNILNDQLVFLTKKNEFGVLNLKTNKISKLGLKPGINKFVFLDENKLLLDNGIIWDIDKNKEEKYIEIPSYDHIEDFNALEGLAIIRSLNEVKIFDVKSRKTINKLSTKMGTVASAIFSKNGKMVIVSSYTFSPRRSCVEIFSIDGQPIIHSLPDGTGPYPTIGISSNDSLLVFGSGEKLILYSLENREILFNIPIDMDSNECSIEFLEDHNLLAVSSNKSLVIIDQSSGEILWKNQTHYAPGIRYLPSRNELLTITSGEKPYIKAFKLNDQRLKKPN